MLPVVITWARAEAAVNSTTPSTQAITQVALQKRVIAHSPLSNAVVRPKSNPAYDFRRSRSPIALSKIPRSIGDEGGTRVCHRAWAQPAWAGSIAVPPASEGTPVAQKRGNETNAGRAATCLSYSAA